MQRNIIKSEKLTTRVDSSNVGVFSGIRVGSEITTELSDRLPAEVTVIS